MRWGVGGAPARVRFTVSGERRSWARRVARIFAEPSGALAGRQKNRRPRGRCGRVEPIHAVFAHGCCSCGQLRCREHPSKIGRLTHHNFAQCVVGVRWRARALHACMCARALEMPFSSTGSRASGIVRQKLVRLLLEEQDKVLRSYFAQKGGTRGQRGGGTLSELGLAQCEDSFPTTKPKGPRVARRHRQENPEAHDER